MNDNIKTHLSFEEFLRKIIEDEFYFKYFATRELARRISVRMGKGPGLGRRIVETDIGAVQLPSWQDMYQTEAVDLLQRWVDDDGHRLFLHSVPVPINADGLPDWTTVVWFHRDIASDAQALAFADWLEMQADDLH